MLSLKPVPCTRRSVPCQPRFPSPTPASLGRGDDTEKVGGFEAGPADERAIDIRQRQDLAGIVRFDRTPIKDADRPPAVAEAVGQTGRVYGRAPPGMSSLDAVSSRPDRPNRLVGDDQIGGRGAIRDRAGELPVEDGDASRRPAVPLPFRRCRGSTRSPARQPPRPWPAPGRRFRHGRRAARNGRR